MKKLFLHAALLSVFASTAAWAEAPVSNRTLGIGDVLSAAFENDPQFLSARAELESRLQAEAFADSSLYPQIVYSYADGRSNFVRTQTNTANPTTTETRTDSRNENLRISQVLYDGEIFSQRRLASLEAKEAEQAFRAEAQRFYLRIVETYINTLLSQEELEAARFNVSFLEEQTRRIKDQLIAGEASRLGVAEAQSELDLAQARLIAIESDLNESRLKLESYTGLKVSRLQGLSKDVVDRIKLKQDLSTFEKLALNNNPTVRFQKYSTERAKEGVELARTGHLPKVSLQLTKSSQLSDSVNTINLDSDVESAQLLVNVPIFEGFRNSIGTTRAGFLYAQAQADLSSASLEVLVRLRNNYRSILKAADRIEAYKTARDSAQLSLEATSEAAKVGLAVNADVLDATQRLYQAETELARVRHESILRVLSFYADIGSLDRSRLEELEQTFAGDEVALSLPDYGDDKPFLDVERLNDGSTLYRVLEVEPLLKETSVMKRLEGEELQQTERGAGLLIPYLPTRIDDKAGQ